MCVLWTKNRLQRYNGDAAVNFEYDIKSRGLTLYRHKPEEGTV